MATVHQHSWHSGSGSQFIAAGDQHITIGNTGAGWPQITDRLVELLAAAKAAGAPQQVVAEIEAAQAAAATGSAPAVRSRLAAAQEALDSASHFAGAIGTLIEEVTRVFGIS